MQKKPLFGKGLTIAVVFLFIGIAIAPCINFSVVKASNENDLVEVTSQACGIKGFGNTTVKLSRQQYQNLEQYLVDFRARLNLTTTREEAVPIFKEAVVELNKYGLLPKGMSVDRAKRLVTASYQNAKLVKYLESLSEKTINSSFQEENEQCLIYGISKSYTYFQGPVSRIVYDILYILTYIADKFSITGGIALLFAGLTIVHALITIDLSDYLRDLPYIGSIIYFGVYSGAPGMEWHHYPAEGSIWTNGVNGIKNWSGQFYGRLSSLVLESFYSVYYPGINGFTGLRLYFNASDFYFGAALNVNIGP
jgi:hypothetical protein